MYSASNLQIDNLVKGASGQAVQNLNLMMGLPENMGLQYQPLFPWSFISIIHQSRKYCGAQLPSPSRGKELNLP
jgi:hypothetical protein